MGIIRLIRNFLWADLDQPEETSDVSDREPASLYRCTACEITYISVEMDVCPNCRETVKPVPTERDLGIE